MREFKRNKICQQNARLGLANEVPRRKILLSTGANNYKPPLERSKSAPKLMSIEEIIGEEEEECEEDGKKPEKPKVEISKCCKEGYLYPSITLGRRRCRRGHSFKRNLLRNVSYTNNRPIETSSKNNNSAVEINQTNETVNSKNEDRSPICDLNHNENDKTTVKTEENEEVEVKQPLPINSSDEDFESFLLYNDYDSKDPLTGDLMSYFDMKLTPMASITAVSLQDITNNNSIFSHHQQRSTISLDNLADYQDYNELDGEDPANNDDEMNEHFILNNKSVDIYEKTENNGPNCSSKILFQRGSSSPSSITDKHDSDESSISSGYQDDPPIFPCRGNVLKRVRSFERLKLQLADDSNDSNCRMFPMTDFKNLNLHAENAAQLDCDSDEFSDESGYVEFGDSSLKSVFV